MCGFCALFAGVPHWTEGGHPLADDVGASRDPAARRARISRIRFIDHLARCHGCRVDDWLGAQFIVRNLRGKTALVRTLPAVWSTLEAFADHPLDPLDAAFLAELDPAT